MVEPEQIAAVRSFNRFYTREIGVLREGLHNSPFPLPEARVLYELSRNPGITASDLCLLLNMDQGYVSRTISKLVEMNLVDRNRSDVDGRQWSLALAPAGVEAAILLDLGSRAEIGDLLSRLDDAGRRTLIESMTTIRSVLEAPDSESAGVALRNHRIGDMGWIVQRHAEIYASEYEWDESFEALIAEIVAAFIRNSDPIHERCWVAEIDGRRVGSVMCVRVDDQIAKLRLLFVDPAGRGRGIGRTLVEECIAFARSAGYARLVLWTQSNLTAARNTYMKLGFVLESSEANHSFGQNLVSETWCLEL